MFNFLDLAVVSNARTSQNQGDAYEVLNDPDKKILYDTGQTCQDNLEWYEWCWMRHGFVMVCPCPKLVPPVLARRNGLGERGREGQSRINRRHAFSGLAKCWGQVAGKKASNSLFYDVHVLSIYLMVYAYKATYSCLMHVQVRMRHSWLCQVWLIEMAAQCW